MKRTAAEFTNRFPAERAAPRFVRGPYRHGFSRLELLVVVVVSGLLILVVQQALLHARETARRQACADNLRQLHLGLLSYHDAFSVLPPAAIWSAPRIAAWPRTDDVAAVTFQNWVQLLLPHLDEVSLANAIDPAAAVGATGNRPVRIAALSRMHCPSDDFHRFDNHYRLQSSTFGEVEFARGNYAINGGTQRMAVFPGTSADPAPDGIHVEQDPATGAAAYWGNGVAGFNKSFAIDTFANGLATTVAVDEVRAGIDPRDSRGVWALGQIGGSITWAHGMNGDAGQPNSNWKRADDVAGCAALHQAYGEEQLVELNMPCCSYCAHNEQAAARSRHPGGVHVLTLDGAVHFLSDRIDPGLWHVMHSRNTPADVLDGTLAVRPRKSDDVDAAIGTPSSAAHDAPVDSAAVMVNGIGMEFVALPAGRFLMGQPDEELNAVFDLEGTATPRPVTLTRPTWIGACEVTRAEYAAVMGQMPPEPATAGAASPTRVADSDRLPVTSVTWHEADEFCRRLSDFPTEAAAGRRYRLPTEAEWEYACRAGSSDPHIYVRERQPGDVSGENAMKDPPLPISAVGAFPANAFGLYDMRGNAWEWCRDWADPGQGDASPVHNPTGPATGFLKIVRGSDWLFVGQRCLLGFRATEPTLRSPYIGFRVICERPDPG